MRLLHSLEDFGAAYNLIVRRVHAKVHGLKAGVPVRTPFHHRLYSFVDCSQRILGDERQAPIELPPEKFEKLAVWDRTASSSVRRE